MSSKNMKRTGNKQTVTETKREELVGLLKHLRAVMREAGENFILRREGEIESVIGFLEALPAGKLRTVVPGLFKDIRKLRVNPAKGRLKDLKALSRLIEELTIRVNSAEDRGRE